MRTFWLYWLAYTVPVLFLYICEKFLVAPEEGGDFILWLLGAYFFLTILIIHAYFFWLGIQGARTSIYPPLGAYVLPGWKRIEGRRARIYGCFIVIAICVVFTQILYFIYILIPH